MACVPCKSSDSWQFSSQRLFETETPDNVSENVDEEDESGIHEAWVDISSRGSSVAACDDGGKKLEKKKSQVFLEGYVETAASTVDDQDDLTRSKSLTGEDLEDLKGCLDLGFGFSYDEIPELCNTLPALELCYSMSQKFLDDKQNNNNRSPVEDSPSPPSVTATPIANWKISSPGDNPDDVKARLKYWAQAVACTVQLCSLMNLNQKFYRRCFYMNTTSAIVS